jgi:serine-type D-Ala-D-Ala carboxypeptidase/endopeptidase (penicillin-binding protein 4)
MSARASRSAACAAALLLAAAALADAQSPSSALPAAYRSALLAAGIPARAASVVIRPLDGGTLQLAENADAAVSPASTMKVVTTYAGLLQLGPAHTWSTEAYALGPVRAGVLDGSLAIRGSGDPTLVIEKFWLLVQRVRGVGIREIRGDLVLDRSAFDVIAHDPDEFDGAESRAYNAGPDALLVNFKAVSFEFVPDPAAGVARVLMTPRLAGANVPPTVRGAAGNCGDWRSRLRADVSDPRAPRFAGEYPLACGTRALHVNALEPADYFAAVFRQLWEDAGGRWTGRVRDERIPSGALRIAAHESRPLIDTIRDINKFSNNVMARQLFLTMGAAATGASATAERGALAVQQALARRGLLFPELVLENGSGLSRVERIAPRNLAALLSDAWRHPRQADFVSSLPISGVDGTLKTRRFAPGAAQLKTGLLNDVRALAGYVQASSGRRYVLVAIINDPRAGAAQSAHDVLVDWLYRGG